MSTTKAAKKSATSTTTSKKAKSNGFTAEERAAMKERARELKAEAEKADGENALLAKIAEMPKSDRAMAKRVHAIVKASAPGLSPKTWYGMPGQVQVEVRDARLQRQGEPRRRHHVADRFRADEVDRRRREEDRRAREEGNELRARHLARLEGGDGPQRRKDRGARDDLDNHEGGQ
jgi:hypothetical protein